MNIYKTLLLLVAYASGLLLTGCGEEQQFTAISQVCISQVSKAAAVEAAEEVLKEMYFEIEKADAESGYVRSRPLAAAQAFEFWRKDNVGEYNQALANMHSIRRIVELEINRQGSEMCIECEVQVQRLNLPEEHVSSVAQGYKMFTKSKVSQQKLQPNPEQKAGMGWIELGGDERLSTKILEEVKKKLGTN